MQMDGPAKSGGDGAMSASAAGRRHRRGDRRLRDSEDCLAAKTLGRAAVQSISPSSTGRITIWFNRCSISSRRGLLSQGDIALPIRDVLRHQRNTRVVGEVVDVDLGARRVDGRDDWSRSEIRVRQSDLVATGANGSCTSGVPKFGHDAPG